MRRLFLSLFEGRLLWVQVISFSCVAALTVGLNALVVSQVVREYLETSESDLVERDMNLARAFYGLKLDEVAAISYRLALDPFVNQALPGAIAGRPDDLTLIDQQISNKVTVLALGGTHLIAVLDLHGTVVAGRMVSRTNEIYPMPTGGTFAALPIVNSVLSTGEAIASTEVIPSEILRQFGLEGQAQIPLGVSTKGI
jgi:hypothetical protein